MYPDKIVCLAAEIPEILHALGALDRVVGISAYTTRPAAALQIPKVSGFQYGSAQRVASTDPDVAILTSGVQKKLAAELAQLGVTLVHVNPHRLEDMFKTVRLLGNLVGESARAMQVVERLQADIEDIRRQAQTLTYRPRVYFEEWMDPIMVGTGWVSDLMEIAGGQDVFRELSIMGRAASQRVVTSEQILTADPEIVFASWCGKPFSRADFVARPDFGVLSALQQEQIHELSGEVLQCGPMLIDSLRVMHGIIREYVQQRS
ncbi:MAG: ABC transporter substrate-binding protein [Firmicutes bacterium]|nr:ABC transporter substrate-binding protein [Bacillota bacterium]